MKSMTGYGKAELTKNGQTVTIELKSVNNRFYDFNCKLPKMFMFLEDALRKHIGSTVNRGRVDLYINYCDNREIKRNIEIDSALAGAYVNASKALSNEFGIINDITTGYLLKTNDVLKIEKNEENEQEIQDLVIECATLALQKLDQMRVYEGLQLEKVLYELTLNIEKNLNFIKANAPKIVAEYREKLTVRIKDVLEQVAYDETKLLNEVAFFTDKSNIDEEIARLDSHILQLRNIFKESVPVGRKLDFLVQELNREANTICSKSNNIDLTNISLELKGDIEKVREQIQNIE